MPYIIDFLPFTITLPGDYILASNLSTDGYGIVIQANDVNINLNGFSINGSKNSDNQFYGISSFDHDRISITNGNITGFQYGIYLSDLVDYASSIDDLSGGAHLVENVVVSDSTFRGIRVEGAENIVKNNSILNIGGSTIYHNDYAFGVESFGRNALIIENKIYNIHGSGTSDLGEGVGISVSYFGDGSVISGNIITNPSNEVDETYSSWSAESRSTWGVWVGGDVATYNINVNNNFIDNFIFGITYKKTVYGEFSNNYVAGSLVPYYRPHDHNGVRVIDGGNNQSDIGANEIVWSRNTPGQIESVEDDYLSPLSRAKNLIYYPLHNPSNGGEIISDISDGKSMIDYWTAPSSVYVDLLNGFANGGGGNDTLVGMQAAQGSKYDDTLIGNDLANLLSGSSGNDMLFGGRGADYLDGGSGFDYTRYDDANYGNLLVSLINPTVNTGAAAGDRYVSIEGLMLGGGNDYGWGNDDDNYIYGLDGNDMLFGGRGADYLDGGSGFDYARYDDANYGNLLVSLINPTVNTGAAAGDRYVSIEGLMLGGGNDYGWGNDGDNYIYGLGGNDMLFGGRGADYLDGGSGFDYARYDDANYGNLLVSLINPTVNTGAAAGDRYVSIEGLILGAGNDYGWGDDGDNYIYGLGGNDMLFGGRGADYLDGGGGNDTLDGGPGNDLFVFRADYGNDRILGFEGGYGAIDCLDFRGVFSTFEQVLKASTQVGNDVYISLVEGCGVALSNFYLGNFSADDVIV